MHAILNNAWLQPNTQVPIYVHIVCGPNQCWGTVVNLAEVRACQGRYLPNEGLGTTKLTNNTIKFTQRCGDLLNRSLKPLICLQIFATNSNITD